MNPFASDVDGIKQLAASYQQLRTEIRKVIVGQDEVVKYVLLSIFCDSHSLLVGVPGLAKTLLVKTVADVLQLDFKRIQFTPDLMPSDIIGAEVLNENRQFQFNKGPLFANIILADEINRTPPKTQSALLEAMQERQVTAAGVQHQLALPFFVLATQNPIEQEGTYPLPEAQLDRFMFNIVLDYPSLEEELQVVKSTTNDAPASVQKVIGKEEIIAFQHLVRRIPIADNVVEYAVKLVASTRPNTASAAKVVDEFVAWGAGPRASQALVIAAKGHAAIHGKFSPDIEDVKAVALPILRHRIIRNFKAEAEGMSMEKIIAQLL
ncbi:MAG: MoxR family ATPase [Chitinophagales bacterium]|jgi:MoxR-like ATPase|nr:MoxR family ATPase [Chitinophagales bacterium]HQO89211.1 MoxR family ATPase [Chitinophagales bacterium]